MNLRHFQIFKIVAETLNFTKAAEQLYITQSAVSHAIKELEDHCGTPLFDRLPKRIQLNASGERFLEEILPILSAVEHLESHVTKLTQLPPIHIVSSITIATFYLPKQLKKFSELVPEVLVKVEVVSAARALECLAEGKADLALLEGAHPFGPYQCHVFASYPLIVVCAPNYPIKSHTLPLASFVTEKLLLREKGSAIRDTIDSALYLAGYTLYPLWTSVNSLALIAATKAELGISILPDVLVQADLDNHQLIELTIQDYTFQNECLLVTHQNKYLNHSLQTLLSIIKGIETS